MFPDTTINEYEDILTILNTYLNMSLAAKKLLTSHKDLIHDISYDFYGKRMATCSSDQSVQVWDIDSEGNWKQTAHWKTHSGSVWRVSWAHPEFGQVLATCSFDRTVAIWEEHVADKRIGGQSGGETHWSQKASLVDSRTSVNDVKFAPRHLGLMLATCSTDGKLRIYEAPDVMNLSQWQIMQVISCKPGASCLSWSPSRAHRPMIAVGTDDQGQVAPCRLQVFEYSEETRKWSNILSVAGMMFDPVHDVVFAPNLGRTYHVLAVCSKDADILHLVPNGTDSNNQTKLETRHPAQLDHSGAQVWRGVWNVTGTTLATAADDGCVRSWKANYQDTWKCLSTIDSEGSSQTVPSNNTVGTHQQPLHSSSGLSSLVSGGFSLGLTTPFKDKTGWMSEIGDL